MRHRPLSTVRPIALGLAILGLLPGCKSAEPPAGPARPDYGAPLAEGAPALRLVTDPADMPDLAHAWSVRDPLLLEAIDQSLRWFKAPSSQRYFPREGITHARAAASVRALRHLLANTTDPDTFTREIERQFEVYMSVGCDDRGTVLYTGYYAPELAASDAPSADFPAPLYRRPADLVTDPVTGQPQGRRTADGGVEPYPTRGEIEDGRLLAGQELVWLQDSLSAYLVHVNGSAKLRMRDGTIRHIGYDGKTDRPYASLGRAMVREGLLPAEGVSVPAIRRVYGRRPADVERLMRENESFVFFTDYPGDNWPAGSLGVRVTGESSLATDKTVFPAGGIVLVDTFTTTFSRGQKKLLRFMLDQDTGGAIRAPGRADIFMGIGETVGILAGEQAAEGRLYYLFLKDEFVADY